MKSFFISLCLILSFSAFSETIESSKNNINVARVVELIKLVNKTDIQVNIVVVDNGGSTDVSPTQSLFFNIYSKGEMFSTDASFNLGPIYSLESAKRVNNGIYEVVINGVNAETSMPEKQIIVIDAQKAIIALKNVSCVDFDCEASSNFKSSIETTLK